MKLSTSDLKTRIYDSIAWLLPSSLVIFMFILLFFGISEQVGNLKVHNTYLAHEISTIKNEISIIKGDVPVKISDSRGNKADYINKSEVVSSLIVDYQKIDLTGKNYWYFSFESESVSPVVYSVKHNDQVIQVFHYKNDNKNEQSSKVFEMIEYDKDQIVEGKSSRYVVVLVDNEVILFNDFINENSDEMKNVFSALSTNNEVSESTRETAKSVLEKI